jgi:hypothetical protein
MGGAPDSSLALRRASRLAATAASSSPSPSDCHREHPRVSAAHRARQAEKKEGGWGGLVG